MWLTDLLVWNGDFLPTSFLHTLWLKCCLLNSLHDWLLRGVAHAPFASSSELWYFADITHTRLAFLVCTWLFSLVFLLRGAMLYLHFKCPCLLFITIFYFSCCHYFIFAFSCTFILYSVLEMKVLNIFVFMYYAFSVITIQLWLLMVTYDCYECWAFTMHFGGHYYTVDV